MPRRWASGPRPTLDARVIARYGQTVRPRPSETRDRDRLELAELLAYRDQLTGEIVARTQQKRLYTSPALLSRAETALASLRREQRELEREIARMLTERETLEGTAALVLSVFGVGTVAAASLLAFLPELGQLDEKEIASLAGLAPMAHDSGQHRGRRHIAEGRSKVRRVLYMAVVAGLRRNAGLRTVYDRLTKAGQGGDGGVHAQASGLAQRDGPRRPALAARRAETAPAGQPGLRRAGRAAGRLRAPGPEAGDSAPCIRWRASLPTGRPGSSPQPPPRGGGPQGQA